MCCLATLTPSLDAPPTGFFLFEMRDTLTMYLAHNVHEEALLVHHTLGIFLYLLTLSTRSYMFLACVVLMQVCSDTQRLHVADCFPAALKE